MAASSDNEEHEIRNTSENNDEVNEEQLEHENEEEQEEQDEEGEHEQQEVEEQDEEQEAEEQNEEHEEEVQQEQNEGEENDENGNEGNEERVENKSDDEEFAGFGEDELKPTTKSKKRQILSDDSDDNMDKENKDENEEEEEENEDDDGDMSKKKKKKHRHHHHKHHHHKSKKKSKSGDDDENGEEEVGSAGGESEDQEEQVDDVEEVANELNEDDVEPAQRENSDMEDENNDGDDVVQVKKNKGESHLEMVLNKQKEENKRKNRRRKIDSEELNEMDNKITDIINEMKRVAQDDRIANEKQLTSIGKIKMLPTVLNMLKKSDYHASMIDLGMLGAIAEWLAPLPDRSLPNIKIREELIDVLRDFGEIGTDYLRSSGIGKAVMFLYKHPKETKLNKQKLEKLINNWSRPIFSLDSNFKQLTKEERLERDIEHVKSLNRQSSGDLNKNKSVDEILNANDKSRAKKQRGDGTGSEDPNKVLRPGDPGFCPRARVPVPSSKDYIVRPKSNMESLENAQNKKIKKSETLIDKHKKRIVELNRKGKSSQAITMDPNK